MAAVFNLKSWVGKAADWQPKAVITIHAVAVNTNLQKNEGRSPLLFLAHGYVQMKTYVGIH